MGPNRILTHAQIDQAIDAPMGWPLRISIAEHLGADVLSDDRRLANTPGLPVRVVHLPL